ncbi:MAG: glycosyltransferase family 10 [Chlamydiota bacterium]
MKTFLIGSLFVTSLSLCAEEGKLKVDIIANFSLDSVVPTDEINARLNYDVRSMWMSYPAYCYETYAPDIHKVIVMNNVERIVDFGSIPKDDRILFCWEPLYLAPDYYDQFSKVYTYNDDLVDGLKFFKFSYPVLRPMCTDIPPFDARKLCVMVTYNPTPDRIEVVRFFEGKDPEDFDLYGAEPIVDTPRYRGSIPGDSLGNEKFSVLKKYKFCMCFENKRINGYVTEKIFACFAAGCLPIYLGPFNIEEYIPKSCYIDYSEFGTNDELYEYITTMSEERYEEYLASIKEYLASEQAQQFSWEDMIRVIDEAASAL